MIKITIDVTAELARLAELKANFSERGALKAIGMRQLGWINQNFQNEGSLVGGWKPLATSTIARRRKGSQRILQDTGRLRASFDLFGMRITSESVTVGSTNSVAAYHEHGTNRLPQRRMLPNEQEATELAKKLINAMIKKYERD